MIIDPIFGDFLVKFVLPIILAMITMYAFGARRRTPHPLLLAVIGELVHKDTFDADSLVRIGLLKPQDDPTLNPLEVVKLLRGGS